MLLRIISDGLDEKGIIEVNFVGDFGTVLLFCCQTQATPTNLIAFLLSETFFSGCLPHAVKQLSRGRSGPPCKTEKIKERKAHLYAV